MKKLLFLLLFPLCVVGQSLECEGKVVSESGEGLSFATILLIDNLQNQKVEATNFDGSFYIKNLSDSPFYLEVSYVGYKTYKQNLTVDDLERKLTIVLQIEERELNELVIERKAPLVKRKIDRLEFDVENSALSALSGWEIVKQTPGVTAQGSDLKIKGSQAILVTINDKRVMLTGDELKNLLENTPGKDIKSIEVITNPPANYDASGSAVLNIVMTKSNVEGYRGILYAKYIQSKYDKELFGLTQYFRKGKLSLMGSYYRGMGTYVREGFDAVHFVENQTTWESEMVRKDVNRNQHTYTFSMEYDLDSLTNFTFGANGFINPNSQGVYLVPTLIYDKDRQVESSYLTKNDHFNDTDYHNFYLQIDKKWGKDHRIIWTNYLTNNHQKKFQNVFTRLNFKDKDPSESTFESDNSSKVTLFSTQIDYSLKRTAWKWDSGAKYSTVTTNSILDFYDDELGSLNFRAEKSNVFEYKEKNLAAYTTLAYTWSQWSFKAGIRAEYTDLTGLVSQTYEHNKQNYLEWFPTFYAQYETENHHQFGVSYGKRISRPGYSWLNPAKSYYNLFSYFQGDAQLKAMIVHNLNLTYSWNNWNVDLYYRKENLPAMEISFQDVETHNLIYRYTNIKEGKMGGLDLSKNYDFFSWLTWNAYASIQYNENYFFGLDEQLYKNDKWIFYGRTSASFRLDKATDWNIELGYYYQTPAIQGTFTISKESSTYFIMNRTFFDRKMELSLIFNDIFKTEKSKVSTNYSNQNNYFLDYQDSQKVSFSVKYHFGNQVVKNKRTIEATEEQGRI
ncbi:outer membrane beta-barrel family protein [Flavobacterium sp. NKUCC04_CG]|uniref:outer membrane beta-barrel family protein n=1 Tax=Flavobacterium sp. NKUCC04_CG TaxID=2842121 RepID=UPI001C5B1C3C|nr:outer membrane beta-barrel family protein [Flavobacterium sp. NKUCC04_CG]MBW3519566.1 TonB-dependent receptor [Flavobacterium sp. NKUCC04_CG]